MSPYKEPSPTRWWALTKSSLEPDQRRSWTSLRPNPLMKVLMFVNYLLHWTYSNCLHNCFLTIQLLLRCRVFSMIDNIFGMHVIMANTYSIFPSTFSLFWYFEEINCQSINKIVNFRNGLRNQRYLMVSSSLEIQMNISKSLSMFFVR